MCAQEVERDSLLLRHPAGKTRIDTVVPMQLIERVQVILKVGI